MLTCVLPGEPLGKALPQQITGGDARAVNQLPAGQQPANPEEGTDDFTRSGAR